MRKTLTLMALLGLACSSPGDDEVIDASGSRTDGSGSRIDASGQPPPVITPDAAAQIDAPPVGTGDCRAWADWTCESLGTPAVACSASCQGTSPSRAIGCFISDGAVVCACAIDSPMTCPGTFSFDPGNACVTCLAAYDTGCCVP